MIFKRRLDLCLLVLTYFSYITITLSQHGDFRFDEMQVVPSDSIQTAITPPSRHQCPPGERMMKLSLLLHSLKWSDVGEKKKEKAIRKLSRFFRVPTNSIKVDDIHTTEMLHMLKHSINKSNNLLNTKEVVGRLELTVGCGDTLFVNSKSLVQKVNELMKSGELEKLSGLPFQWWNIWSDGARRKRRQIAEGSGDGEDDEFYPDYDEDEIDEEDDGEESDGEQLPPTSDVKKQTPQRKKGKKKSSKTKPKYMHDDEPPAAAAVPPTHVEENLNENTDVDYPPIVEHEIPITPAGESEKKIVEVEEIEEIEREEEEEEREQQKHSISEMNEPITVRTNDNVIDGPTPIGTSEILKLENEVDKTIENANNVRDVVVPPIQQEDKILEEIVKMISNAPEESATTVNDITTILQSTTETPIISVTYHKHNHHNEHVEVDVEEESKESTTMVDENAVRSTIDLITIPSTITTTMTNAPEVETIFPSINNIHNNEHHHYTNAFDEKLPIVVETTTMPATTSMIEESFTVEKMSPSSPTSTSSSIHEHETTTYPPITTIHETTAEIITTTATPSESYTTISSPSISTTTPRIVDATIAHVATMVDKVTTASTTTVSEEKITEDESNYDDEYDDEDNNEITTPRSALKSTTLAKLAEVITQAPQLKTTLDYEDEESSSISSTVPTSEVTSEAPDLILPSSEEPDNSIDYDDTENTPPFVVKRIKKLQTTSGKAFSHKLEDTIFNDAEDGKDLSLELLDKNGQPLSPNSWIRFNAAEKEIYGLPLEKDVSQHEFKMRATDKGGEYVDETVDVTVQQHKSFRSVNHQIYIQVTLEKTYESNVDWEIRLIRGIVEALGDNSMNSIVVRDVRPNQREDRKYTFVYTNDTLTKDKCPDEEVLNLMNQLTMKALNDAMRREITVRNVEKDMIGICAKASTPQTPIISPARNFPPSLRNPIDRVQATVGQLLVYEVPTDTFYDPEDQTDLRLVLLNEDRSNLDANHWLQFDSKNKEFYGVPMVSTPHGFEERYALVAYDKKNESINDALVVEVVNKHHRQDYSATFEFQLDTPYEQFQLASTKRKFLERIALFFEDLDTDQIVMKSVKKLTSLGRISVVIQNTTLYNEGEMCPKDRIRKLKNLLVAQDGSVQDGIKQALGSEFNVLKIAVARAGKCAAGDSPTHEENLPVDTPNEYDHPFKVTDEVLITYVLPTAIILLMLLIALLIACLLYKRRNTGKMELGDEEERKSFRSKGIPVIFQDELDEKPEIVTKSPVILKDEKPPLLPQYNGMNGQDGDDDNLDQYIPPQGLPLMGSRESRGKSPVTPSYRKPPPYVSP